MKQFGKSLGAAMGLLMAFVLWTIAVCTVNVQAIGPQGSSVGFAGINRYVHDLTGVHFGLYTVTDWLGLVPIGVCAGFGVLGLAQWVRRRSLLKVDCSLFVLGGFYLVVMAAYVFFEVFVVNYRPVLIEGRLEASYPSSTTMLVLCVMPTATMQLKARVGSRLIRRCVCLSIAVFTAFMIIGRLISGVHWLSDIIGGMLLGAGMTMLYRAVCSRCE